MTIRPPHQDPNSQFTTPDNAILGIVLMIGFCLTAPLLDAAAKLATDTLSVGLITAVRFVLQGLLMAPICLMLGLSFSLPRTLWPVMILRALSLIISTFCFIAALRVMAIADALAIAFVEPFILLFLGKLLFGEDVGPRRIAAAVVGFSGAILVIQPSLAAFGLVALYPLGTAVFFAIYILVTRHLSRSQHPFAMQFMTSWVGGVLCLPFLALGYAFGGFPELALSWPQGMAWLWLFGVGFWATVAHGFMSYALQNAPSATIAPIHYFEIVSAVVIGYLVFGDFPNHLAMAGMVVIIASGLYVLHRERLAAREAREEAREARRGG